MPPGRQAKAHSEHNGTFCMFNLQAAYVLRDLYISRAAENSLVFVLKEPRDDKVFSIFNKILKVGRAGIYAVHEITKKVLRTAVE